MTNPADLLGSIVTSLQAIEALVTALGDDESKIFAYQHRWPTSTSWQLALWKLKPPAIMVIHRGTRNGRFGSIPSRVHDFSLLIRDGESSTDVYALFDAIMNGVPTSGGGLKWPDAPIDDAVDMINTPEFYPRTLLVTEDSALDYHEVQFGLTEKIGC